MFNIEIFAFWLRRGHGITVAAYENIVRGSNAGYVSLTTAFNTNFETFASLDVHTTYTTDMFQVIWRSWRFRCRWDGHWCICNCDRENIATNIATNRENSLFHIFFIQCWLFLLIWAHHFAKTRLKINNYKYFTRVYSCQTRWEVIRRLWQAIRSVRFSPVLFRPV